MDYTQQFFDWWNINSTWIILLGFGIFFLGVYVMNRIKKSRLKKVQQQEKKPSELFTESILFDTATNIEDTMMKQKELIESEMENVKANSLALKKEEDELLTSYRERKDALNAQKSILANRYMQLKASLDIMNKLTSSYKQIEKNLGGK